jgi:hypothetical protein
MPNVRPGQKIPLGPFKKPSDGKASGSDIVTTTAFELIGVGLMALLAGVNDQMGSIVVIIMAGFLLGWLLVNSGTLTGWMKNL